jgi:hypothetical protein
MLRCLGRTQPVVDEEQVVESELRRDIREKKLRLAMAKQFDKLKESAQIENYLASSLPSQTDRSVRPVSHQQEQPASPHGRRTKPSARRR